MYIYLTDASGGSNCCFVPDDAWPNMRTPVNAAARANGMTFIVQTTANQPNDVTANCSDASAAQSWIEAIAAGGGASKFGAESLERGIDQVRAKLSLLSAIGDTGQVALADVQAISPSATQAAADVINGMSPSDRQLLRDRLTRKLATAVSVGYEFSGEVNASAKPGSPLDPRAPAVLGLSVGGFVLGAAVGGLWPAVVLGGIGAWMGTKLFGKK